MALKELMQSKLISHGGNSVGYRPRFQYTHRIANALMQIEGARRVVDVLPLPPDVGLRLRQEARQRSTHHSTKIEGNRLQETAIPHIVAHPVKRREPDEMEVRNYWRALEWIEIQTDSGQSITESRIRELHAIVYPTGSGRPPRYSNWREEERGVVDWSHGDYEYMAPTPKDVPQLMKDLADWASNGQTQLIPAPVRSAILSYQFVTIHPFLDGNGRTSRALATMELWRSGYGMRGFLSMEEYYTRDLKQYYSNLQMGLPVNYYEGRHDPDLTPWIEYFCSTMAEAATAVRERAEQLYKSTHIDDDAPWQQLTRLQQQLVSRCLVLAMESNTNPIFLPSDVSEWFSVSLKTAREWLAGWRQSGLIEPSSGNKRIRKWQLTPQWNQLVMSIAVKSNTSHRQQ